MYTFLQTERANRQHYTLPAVCRSIQYSQQTALHATCCLPLHPVRPTDSTTRYLLSAAPSSTANRQHYTLPAVCRSIQYGQQTALRATCCLLLRPVLPTDSTTRYLLSAAPSSTANRQHYALPAVCRSVQYSQQTSLRATCCLPLHPVQPTDSTTGYLLSAAPSRTANRQHYKLPAVCCSIQYSQQTALHATCCLPLHPVQPTDSTTRYLLSAALSR